MRSPTVGDLGEDRLLERIQRVIDAPPKGVLGIGDDAAVFGAQLLTTDTLVEHSHFRRAWCTPEELGWKALAVNMSDVAAMGGTPRAALVSLILPATTSVDVVLGMYRGIRRLAHKSSVAIVGGNLAKGSPLSITLTVTGDAKPPVLRSGARPGDKVFVSGQPGLARLGYLILKRSLPGKENAWLRPRDILRRRKRGADAYPGGQKAIRRFLLPEPRINLARDVRPTAMMDVSDGLAADLPRLARASGVGMVIDTGLLPVSRAFRALAEALRVRPEAIMLEGGEDYELVITLPRSAETPEPVAWHCIGEVVSGKNVLVRHDGRTRPLAVRRFDHFKTTMMKD
jgi:thiamine-monophosphate kinase